PLHVDAATGQVRDAHQVHERIDFEHRLEQLGLEARETLNEQDVDLLLDHVNREADRVVLRDGIAAGQLERAGVRALRLWAMADFEAAVRPRVHSERLAYDLAVFLEGDDFFGDTAIAGD